MCKNTFFFSHQRCLKTIFCIAVSFFRNGDTENSFGVSFRRNDVSFKGIEKAFYGKGLQLLYVFENEVVHGVRFQALYVLLHETQHLVVVKHDDRGLFHENAVHFLVNFRSFLCIAFFSCLFV